MKIFKIVVITLLITLLAMRLALPYVLLNYVETQINKIPEYRVKIDDLDVHLYRGSYTIKHIQLWKMSKQIPVPFFSAKSIDLSLDWASLFKGKLVAKIHVFSPTLHFVTDPNSKNEQLSINDQWLDIVKSLFPLNINQLVAENGKIYFENFSKALPFKTFIEDVNFKLENMQKVINKNTLLPSVFTFSAKPIGGGSLKAEGEFNPFNRLPTFYFKIKLVSLNIYYLKNILKYYTHVNATKGTFSLYGETAAAKGKITGYLKPFIKNLEITPVLKEGPLNVIYNGAAAVVGKILENREKKTIATDIKLSGNVTDPNVSILSILGYLIRHGFIQALLPQIDQSVKMQDIIYGKK